MSLTINKLPKGLWGQSKVYIAGPMQGYPDFNFPEFAIAAHYLRNLGWQVFSPAERDEKQYGSGKDLSAAGDIKEAEAKGFDLREALAADCKWICENADAIYMLKGWENSKGAQAEWALARALSLTVFYQ